MSPPVAIFLLALVGFLIWVVSREERPVNQPSPNLSDPTLEATSWPTLT